MALLRHLALRCRDMEKSRAFYEQAIGWKFLGNRPSGTACDLTDGTCNITLIQQPADCERTVLEEGNEFIHFGVIVTDLEACRRRLEQLHAVFSTDSIKQPGNSASPPLPETSLKVLDPDGNVVDVTVNREEWRGVSLQP